MKNLNAEEQAKGFRWLFGAGAIAVVFSFALWQVDLFLSNSDSEKRLGATLLELRTAQTSLPGRVIDSRQSGRGLITQPNSQE